MSSPERIPTLFVEYDSQSVERRAREVLARHAHFRGRAGSFEFQSTESILVVRGVVPTFYLKQLLQSVLRELEGVTGIDNQVNVISSEGVSSDR